MRLTLPQDDPLIIFGQLDPQPSPAPPPCVRAKTSAAIPTAGRSVAEIHQQADRSFEAACGIATLRGNYGNPRAGAVSKSDRMADSYTSRGPE